MLTTEIEVSLLKYLANILKTEGRSRGINSLECLVVSGQGKRWGKNNQPGKSMRGNFKRNACMYNSCLSM